VTWMQSLVVYVSLGVVVAGCEERHNLGRLWGHLSKRRRQKAKTPSRRLRASIVFPGHTVND
jgi:hypothetical protein